MQHASKKVYHFTIDTHPIKNRPITIDPRRNSSLGNLFKITKRSPNVCFRLSLLANPSCFAIAAPKFQNRPRMCLASAFFSMWPLLPSFRKARRARKVLKFESSFSRLEGQNASNSKWKDQTWTNSQHRSIQMFLPRQAKKNVRAVEYYMN